MIITEKELPRAISFYRFMILFTFLVHMIEESRRIVAAGGWIEFNRVNGKFGIVIM